MNNKEQQVCRFLTLPSEERKEDAELSSKYSVTRFTEYCGVKFWELSELERIGMSIVLYISICNVKSQQTSKEEIRKFCGVDLVEESLEYHVLDNIANQNIETFHNLLRDSLARKTTLLSIFDANLFLFGMAYGWLRKTGCSMCDVQELQQRLRQFYCLNYSHPYIHRLTL